MAAALLDLPARPTVRREAAPILDLYARGWQGERLHSGDYIVCTDEKLIPSAAPQARAQRHGHARDFAP